MWHHQHKLIKRLNQPSNNWRTLKPTTKEPANPPPHLCQPTFWGGSWALSSLFFPGARNCGGGQVGQLQQQGCALGDLPGELRQGEAREDHRGAPPNPPSDWADRMASQGFAIPGAFHGVQEVQSGSLVSFLLGMTSHRVSAVGVETSLMLA